MSLLLVALIAIVLAGVTSTVAWNRSRDQDRRWLPDVRMPRAAEADLEELPANDAPGQR